MSDKPTPRRRRAPVEPTVPRAGLDAIGAGLDCHIPRPDPPGLGEAMIERVRAASQAAAEARAESDHPEGLVSLPRRASFWAVCAMLVALAGQVFWAGSYTTTINNRLDSLAESDTRILARSDERHTMLTNRLESLERDRDRLPKLEERFGRIEEKMTMMIELLRETRQERRESPGKRGG